MTVTRLRTNYVLLLENTSFLLFRSHWSTWSTPNLNDQNHLSLTIYILAIHFFTRGITPSISASFSLTLSRQLHSTSPYQDPESLSLSSKFLYGPEEVEKFLYEHPSLGSVRLGCNITYYLHYSLKLHTSLTLFLMFTPHDSFSDLRFFSSGLTPCQPSRNFASSLQALRLVILVGSSLLFFRPYALSS